MPPGVFLASAISSAIGVGLERRVRDQTERNADQLRHRHEVGERIVAGVRLHVRHHGQHAVVRHDHGVAVRIGAGAGPHADHAGAAGHVLDERPLAELFAHLVGDQARDDVDRAAGGERHQKLDRAIRVGLRLGERRT